MSVTVEVDRNGRILLPAKLRKSRNWVAGTLLIIDEKGENLDISSKSAKIDQAIEKFQLMVNKSGKSKNLVDNFQKFKSDEVIAENRK